LSTLRGKINSNYQYKESNKVDLQKLLDYVEKNARDVSDLIKVADIRRIEHCDPWRSKLIKDIRQRYESEAIEADLRSTLEE
jgi:hypothetical protein